MKKLALFVLLGVLSAIARAEEPPTLLRASDLAGFPNPAPTARIPYGDGALQFGDLRVPDGDGPHPVMIFLHGGCWLSQYDIAHSSKLTDAFARAGIATWSLEYRRVGDDGGGWPGTFQDVARGADHLRAIAGEYDLDLDRVIAAGHSAGGHLALWLAARTAIPENSPISSPDPIRLRGVLALAPASDLGYLHAQEVCGEVIDKLMGGSPAAVPRRYAAGDPARIAPDGVPQVLVIGTYDDYWATVGRRYFETATGRGDDVRAIEATESGHFEMIDPDSTTWPLVLEAARGLVE